MTEEKSTWKITHGPYVWPLFRVPFCAPKNTYRILQGLAEDRKTPEKIGDSFIRASHLDGHLLLIKYPRYEERAHFNVNFSKMGLCEFEEGVMDYLGSIGVSMEVTERHSKRFGGFMPNRLDGILYKNERESIVSDEVSTAVLFAERYFKDEKEIRTCYGLEGEITEVGSLSNYELNELAGELRRRESVSTRRTIYKNYQDSEITTSQKAPIEGSGLSLVVLKTGLDSRELRSLAQMLSGQGGSLQ